jgi:hypothetical protein
MKDRANVYALAVIAVATVVLASSLKGFLTTLTLDPRGVAIWFAMLAAAGLLTYVTLRGGGAVTGTAVVNFAVVVTYGGEVASWLAAIQMLILTLVLLKFGAIRSLFNASQMAISLAGAGLVYRVAGGESLALGGGRIALGPSLVAAFVLCHLAYLFANTWLVAVWTGLGQHRSVPATWKANYMWMLPQSFAAPVVGVALAYLFVGSSLWLVAVFFLWLVYYARGSRTNLELQHSQRETVAALASIVDSSTPFLSGESERVAGLAVELGRKMGLSGSRLRSLECAALLHDAGYLAIGGRILSKHEALSPLEWAAVVRHSETGASILGKMRGLKQASSIVLAHHERPDGRGYPRGLKQGEIPRAAGILKVADAFVAMTTERPYRKAMTPSEAMERMWARAGSQFDKDAVQTMLMLHRAGGLYRYAAGEAKAA